MRGYRLGIIGAVLGLLVIIFTPPILYAANSPSPAKGGPNIVLSDALGQFWVLGTSDLGSQVNALKVVCTSGCASPPAGGSTGVNPNVKTVTTGGTAVSAFLASTIVNGAIVINPKNASESLYVDMVNTAQVSQTGGSNGTSVELVAGQSFVLPGGLTNIVSVNATSSSHAFVAYRW